jgi:DDE superfamily endonuclease
VEWIKHFDSMTQSNLQSSDEYHLLICDGHDSHISADFVSYCIQHRIDVILLPPHSSHMLQPLDVAVFGPLKTAISNQLSRFIGTGIRQIQKVEWLEQFVNAREKAITKENILSGWRGAGIFPENMHRILIQILEVMTQYTTLTPPPVTPPITTFFPNSSPPDPTSLRSINQAFLTEISTAQVTTPIKTQIRWLSGISKILQADKTILTEQINEIQMIQAKRMERQSGKQFSLKGKLVITTEMVRIAVTESEKSKKAKRKPNGKKRQRGPVSSEKDEVNGSDENDVSLELWEGEMLDCIKVGSHSNRFL